MTIESIHPSSSTLPGAMRIAFVCDPYLDADARCACDIISTLPGVNSNWIKLSETTTPILLRELSRLIRHRNELDLLITAGRSASKIGKFWPGRWLDIGTTDHRGHVRPARVGLAIEPGSASRANLRGELEIDADDRVIYAPGRPSYRSHFTAFHTASILHFNDSSYRLLVEDPTQNWLQSMSQKLEQPNLLVNHGLADSDIVRVADIVLFAPGANPARLPVARAMALKVPLVVAHNRYTNWLDQIVSRVDPPKPRLLAKAIMRGFDQPQDDPKLEHARDWIHQRFDRNRSALAWAEQLASVTRARW